MRVTVTPQRCCGAGNCVMVAPEVFDQDGKGVVVLRVGDPPADLHEAVREAADICPSGAVEVTG